MDFSLRSRDYLHDVELLGWVQVEIPAALLREDQLDEFVDLGGDLDVVEELWFCVVAGFDIAEDVGEEDDFELVEVEDLDHVQQHLVGVVIGIIICCLLQDLVGFVGET